MRMNRRGTTSVVVLWVLVIAMLIAGVLVGLRVKKLNDWAVLTDEWLSEKLYKWIHDSSFQQGGAGGGDPDPTKPPPPPDGLH